MAPAPMRGEVARPIKLPHSSTRLELGRAFCKVLTRVRRDAPFSLGFEGRIYRSGAMVERGELPETVVVLECAGLGPMEGRKRQIRWVLWLLDEERAEWRKIAEASSIGWEWALVLREPAYQLLQPKRGLFDVLDMGRTVAEEIAELIGRRVETEPEDVRVHILAAVYDRLAGQIAENASGGFPPLNEERRRPLLKDDDDDSIQNTPKKGML